jgi:hypothetical protein
MQRPRIFFITLLFLFCSVILIAQRGALTNPSTLEQLTAESQLIVHGYVVSSRVEPHPDYPNLSTVVVEIRVADVLKGSTPERFQYRQFIWDIRDRMDANGYRKGQEVVLLLGPTSKLGLRSPAGLEQGRFLVTRTAGGKKLALNGTGNMTLFTEGAGLMSAPAKKSSVQVPATLRSNPKTLTLEELTRLIRAYAGGN